MSTKNKSKNIPANKISKELERINFSESKKIIFSFDFLDQ